MPQGITPTLGTTPHPSLRAPANTKMMTIASCTPAGGAPWFGLPFVVYPIAGHKYLGGPGNDLTGRVKQVPPAVAAADLAWWPTSPAPRLASDAEVTAYATSLASGAPELQPGRSSVTI